MNKAEKRALRKVLGSYVWALLIYYVLLNFLVSTVAEIALIYEGLRAVIRSGSWMDFALGIQQAMEDVLLSNAWGYLIACAIAVAAIRLWKGKPFFLGMFDHKRVMTPGDFIQLVCLLLSAQVLVQTLAMLAEWILQFFGLSILESLEMASAGADSFSMFLYMGLAAPVVEELVFRGLILRGMEPWGKRFAIVASSLLFGLFHGNLIQSPYAFAVGLVLGYTAMEYSITWAMLLHMVNNLVLGDMLPRLLSGLPGVGAELVIWALIFVCFLAALWILWRNRRMIALRSERDPIHWAYMRSLLTAFPTLVLMVVMGFSAVMMLFL